MNKIIVIGGGKGGVGKSMVAMAMTDALLADGKNLVVVESDDSNPDIYKSVHETILCEVFSLDDPSGYIALGNFIERHKESWIVINSAARATTSLIENSPLLADVSRELERELVMLWPVNRQRDSLELLKTFLDKAVGFGATYAVINTHFGSPEKFQRYFAPSPDADPNRPPKLRERVTGTIIFPELNDNVADKLTDNRLALWTADASGKLSIAERSALRQFREAAKKALEVIYGKHYRGDETHRRERTDAGADPPDHGHRPFVGHSGA